jgi:acyl carrier protein
MEPTFGDVKSVVITTLGIQDRAALLGPLTPLLGNLPELDSLAVVQLIYALEEHFGLTIEDEEVTAELFETLGGLAAFVEHKLR